MSDNIPNGPDKHRDRCVSHENAGPHRQNDGNRRPTNLCARRHSFPATHMGYRL